jgi:dihydroceramidase
LTSSFLPNSDILGALIDHRSRRMALNLRFPYRESREGLWGEHTSTLNWCEEDYNVTYYCAEFVNTITNASFLYLAVKGIRSCIRYSHPPIYILGYLGFMVVGLGSIAFHSTLKCPLFSFASPPRDHKVLTLAFQTQCSSPTSCP